MLTKKKFDIIVNEFFPKAGLTVYYCMRKRRERNYFRPFFVFKRIFFSTLLESTNLI